MNLNRSLRLRMRIDFMIGNENDVSVSLRRKKERSDERIFEEEAKYFGY